ncbi:hypothetical protein WBG99_25940 [Streptomyces sp. TG1A-60]|uniref:hypothetical protein n=1 Tax=Streptomyces sp. TG1A-60 TaxID=3129111 RepID=UPI0030CD843E
MTPAEVPRAGTPDRRRRRRLAWALVATAPLVAEFASGNLPVIYVWLLVIYAPLYGGAAVFIRDLGRRSARPWPVIFTLGLAYGVVEESFISFSLFNPDYADLRLLDFGWIPALGIGSWWTTFVVLLHAVWSICVPIALVEALAGDLADRPWLTPRGLAWAVLAIGLGGAATAGITLSEDDFMPSSAHLAGAAVAVTALIALAGWLARTPRRPSRAAGDGAAPPAASPELAASGQPVVPAGAAPTPQRATAAAVSATLLFVAGAAQVGPAPAVVTVYLVLVAWGVTAVRRWSARPGWSPRHRLALAAGALVPHLAFAVAQRSLVEVPLWLDLLGNLIFISGTTTLVMAGWRAVGRSATP